MAERVNLRWITNGADGLVYIQVDDVYAYARNALTSMGPADPAVARSAAEWCEGMFEAMHTLAMSSVMDAREFDLGVPARIEHQGATPVAGGIPALPGADTLARAVTLGNEMADALERCVKEIENLQGTIDECLSRARLASTALDLGDNTEATQVLSRLCNYLVGKGADDPLEGD